GTAGFRRPPGSRGSADGAVHRPDEHLGVVDRGGAQSEIARRPGRRGIGRIRCGRGDACDVAVVKRRAVELDRTGSDEEVRETRCRKGKVGARGNSAGPQRRAGGADGQRRGARSAGGHGDQALGGGGGRRCGGEGDVEVDFVVGGGGGEGRKSV